VVGQAAPETAPDLIRAKKFQVVNEAGMPVVTLQSWSGGGWIETRNHQGKHLFAVAANDGGDGALSTYSAEGKGLVTLSASAKGGQLAVFNAEGKELVSLAGLVAVRLTKRRRRAVRPGVRWIARQRPTTVERRSRRQ
jgi:hypothetical protein